MFKTITAISFGVEYEDSVSYDFKLHGFAQNNWNVYKLQITVGVMICVISSILFHMLSYKLKSECFEKITFAIYILGLIIPNFILSILFVINYSNDVPELYWPSILVLCIPLLINFCIIAVAIYKGIKDPDIGENFKEWIKDYRNLIAIFIILVITDFEYLKILKDMHKCIKRFGRHEQLEYIFEIAIINGAFFDIIFRNIPQIIIQVSKYLTL
ncbi:hypothetical protein F8M41_017630 [Gigaspora margarita]|uniref:Uncharacterized protein n=1 Tax=Gigaspora margarita TaxID=4874 RepID=A0A8H4B2R0_GIGMA|nr:hypothetical protein F8M41_017630 [Gigaspora margarita]